MTDRVLIDTGPIVAILSPADSYHSICVAQLQRLTPPLFTCWPVLTEVAWMLRDDRVGERLQRAFTNGFLGLSLGEEDIPSIARHLSRHQSARLQIADAALMHLARREHCSTIFTLDRKHFRMMLGKSKKLRLIPDGTGT